MNVSFFEKRFFRKCFTLILFISGVSAYATDGSYTLTVFDQNWIDDFEQESGRSFTIKPDPEGPPSERMAVIYDMESLFVPSDAGKTAEEVFSRPEFGLTTYSVYYSGPGYPGFPEAPPEYFTIDYDPDGRLGLKRKVVKGETVPHSGIYLQFAEMPGVAHACVSVDMFIPSDFEFGNTQGKLGFGLNAGSNPNNGGSTPVEEQDGASTRVVRGLGFDTRPYTYALNRVELTGQLYGYQEPSDDAPVPHGEWVRYELEIKVNDVGQSNGFVKMWANGVKFSEYTGLVYRTDDQPFLLNKLFINDMWQVHHDYHDKVPLKSGHYWYSNYKVLVPDGVEWGGSDWSSDFQSVNFGYQVVGEGSDILVNFTNESGGSLSGTLSEDSEHFSIVTGEDFIELGAGETHQVTLRYSPATPGEHGTTLELEGGSGISIPVVGLASTLQDPSSIIDGSSGTLLGAMVDQGGHISTDIRDEGTAIYAVDIQTTGTYKIDTTVNSPTDGSNSFFVAFDAQPSESQEVWDILPLTSGFESRAITLRGLNGTFDNPEFSPATWLLSEGVHYLVIQGREIDTQLRDLSLSLVEVINPPAVSIFSPAGGSTVELGTVITFTGTAASSLDGDLSAELVWSSSVDGIISGQGTSVSTSSLSEGEHIITASVTDSQGIEGQSIITVSIAPVLPPATNPTVEIHSPIDGSTVEFGTNVTFAGSATGAGGADLETSLVWTSNLDGVLTGNGGTLTTSALSLGLHTITATATDGSGLSGTAKLTLAVLPAPPPVPPSVTILAPASGSTVELGTSVNFSGVAANSGGDDLSPSLVWTSNLDGVLAGGGGSLTTNALSLGAHTITATVTDSSGVSGGATIFLAVLPPAPSPAPSVTILDPANGSSVEFGSNITFAGAASSPDGADLGYSLVWSSSLDGVLSGTGHSISTSSLSVGAHIITASATDGEGIIGKTSIAVSVLPMPIQPPTEPTVTILNPANGTSVETGTPLTFTGVATSSDGSDLSSSIVWSSSLDGDLPVVGDSLTTNALSVGVHTITASATDADGVHGETIIALAVLSETPPAAPTVSIVSPVNGATVESGTTTTFIGAATGSDGQDLGGSLVWNSSLDGLLPSMGASVSTSSLSEGAHTITASVTDSNGAIGEAMIALAVIPEAPPAAPEVTIISPFDGSTVDLGATLALSGIAISSDGVDLTSTLVWSSSRDGTIPGVGPSIATNTLSLGAHIITATATDSRGAIGEVSIAVSVLPDGSPTPPVVTIVSPDNGSSLQSGSNASFFGVATSVDGTDLGASLVWSSSLDGVLQGTGATLIARTLSEGVHIITASATDSQGIIGEDRIAITVVPESNPAPSVSITTPNSGSSIEAGTSVTFTGTAISAAGSDLGASLVWSSSLDGTLSGSGPSLTSNSLSVGAHTITASAADSSGIIGESTIVLAVFPGAAPSSPGPLVVTD